MLLTSSNFAAACGINPYCSRQKLARLLRGEETVELNEHMLRGMQHEPDAVKRASDVLEIPFESIGDDQQHHVRYWNGWWLGTTPDGSFRGVGLEAKCPATLRDDVPAHYLPQIFGQMWLAPIEAVYYTEWTPEEQRIWRIPYSELYIEWLMERLKEFMHAFDSGEAIKRRKKPTPPNVAIERIL